jgi:hypothetical protein
MTCVRQWSASERIHRNRRAKSTNELSALRHSFCCPVLVLAGALTRSQHLTTTTNAGAPFERWRF